MKIVINKCHGGFGLSQKAMERYAELKGFTLVTEKVSTLYPLHYRDEKKDDNLIYDIPRNCPDLVKVVEELGSEEASDRFAELKVVEVPDGVDWGIEEYDGLEWIAEHHRTWS